ncbi:MAG: hypothetical protein QM488_07575 [Rhizobiaceae bacterium]
MTHEAHLSLKQSCRGISLGIFAGDFGNFRSNMQSAAKWGCNVLHFDVMDGLFVPQMTGGPGFVKALKGEMILDVHLMVQKPLVHIASYVEAGADIVTIHAESEEPVAAFKAIRTAAEKSGRPVMAGISLMPGTSIENIKELFDLKPDLILVLALDPRTSDSTDVTKACVRLQEIRTLTAEFSPILAFDGGVTLDTIAEISSSSAELVVSGSAVLKSANPSEAFRLMQSAL